jgi:nicotinamidase-related amidase
VNKFTLTREDTVLMIIDIQDRLLPTIKYRDQLIQRTNVLLDIANALAIPAFLTEQYPKGLGQTTPDLCRNLESHPVFKKTTFSAYTPEVAEYLKKLQRKKIIIAGMETHVCVFQTVRNLISEGYEVFVAEDAVCSRASSNWMNGLKLMSDMGAVITNIETIMFDLLKESGTVEFKQLSKLIK